MMWLSLTPYPISSQQDVSLSQSTCVLPIELTEGGGGARGGGGAKSDDGEKDWSSINHSILSGVKGGRWPNMCKDLWR
jgi:hypothetical protein